MVVVAVAALLVVRNQVWGPCLRGHVGGKPAHGVDRLEDVDVEGAEELNERDARRRRRRCG